MLKIIDCVHCQYLGEILGFFFLQHNFGDFCRVSPCLSLLSGSTVSLQLTAPCCKYITCFSFQHHFHEQEEIIWAGVFAFLKNF